MDRPALLPTDFSSLQIRIWFGETSQFPFPLYGLGDD